MVKFPLLFLSIFMISKNGDALECYVTDLDAMKSQGIDAAPKLQNCKDYFDTFGGFGDSETNIRCSTVTAVSAQGTMTIQGCLSDGDVCDDLKNQIRSLEPVVSLHFDSIKCDECNTDYCNGGVTRTVVINQTHFTRELNFTHISIFTFVGLAIMAIISAIVYAIKRTRKSSVPSSSTAQLLY